MFWVPRKFEESGGSQNQKHFVQSDEDEGEDEEIFLSFSCVFRIILGSAYLLN